MATMPDTRLVAMDRAVERAFAALRAAGATWCVLRGETRLSAPRNDVDLLVSPGDLAGATAALAAAGFGPLPVRSAHRLFVAYEPADDRWVKLDLVSELVYGRPPTFRVPAVAACLDLRADVDGVPLLALEDRFWSMLLHIVLDRKEPAEARRHHLSAIAAQIDPGRGPFAEYLRESLGAEVPARLAAMATRDEWGEVQAAIAASVPRPSGRKGRRAGMLRRLRSRVGRRGVSVALLGPDGAGKSTLAAGLRDTVPLATRCLYMGMQAGASVPGKTWTASPGAHPPARRRRLPVRLARQSQRLLRLARRSALAWVLVHTGHLVIFDRFPYDAEVHWANVSSPGARLRLWLLRHAVLRPDVVVLLDVPGEVTYQRKREHSPALLELRRERYLSIAARLEHVHVIDATRPVEAVRSEATSLVWSAYTRKHARRRA